MKAIPQKSADYISALAIIFKILATIEAIGIAIIFMYGLIVETHTPVHAIPFQVMLSPSIMAFVVVLLVILPNRWIVRSPTLYPFSLFMAALPFCFALLGICSGSFHTESSNNVLPAVGIMLLFLPWPLSLLLSSIRFKQGESFWYA
jgi:hypothetical protein